MGPKNNKYKTIGKREIKNFHRTYLKGVGKKNENFILC